MIKIINESGSSTSLLKSSDGMFELIKVEGVGMSNTPYTALKVESSGLAEKHVVEIRLQSTWQDFTGDPVKYSYYGVEVAHGMRSVADTLKETQEYIGVLQSALSFAYKVEDYIADNGWKH